VPRYRKDLGPETLSEFLNGFTVPELKKLGGLLASGLPTRKAELVAFIRTRMESAERLRQLWERLDRLQQAAVAEAVHSLFSAFDPDLFRAKYGEDPSWGERTKYGEMKSPSLLCLFLYGTSVPRDLKERLLAFVPPPPQAEVRTEEAAPETITLSREWYDYAAEKHKAATEEVPLVRCETERAAQHDLRAVLRLIDAGKVSVSDKTRRVTSAGARAIAGVLQGGDFYRREEAADSSSEVGPIRAFAWPLLLQSAGLANLSGRKLQLTRAGKRALGEPPHQVVRGVWQRWLKTTLLDEFRRINAVRGQTGKGKRWMTAVAERRAAIAEGLGVCPPNRWIAFDEFSRFIVASGWGFEVTRNPWSLYIAESRYGSLGYAGSHDWSILQARYMMAFLFEYAATLGLIDVGYIHPADARPDYFGLWGTDGLDYLSRYDGLFYVRINGLGAWCLGQTQEYVPSAPEASQTLRVLPNLDVVAMEPLPPGDALFLEQFAERVSESVWHIQRPRLLRVLEDGVSVAEVEAFLEAKSGATLPHTAAVFFRDVADRASRLTDRGFARLIEAQDPVLAQLIANDSRLRSLCLVAGERHIVVPSDSEAAFRRALRELGYTLSLPREVEE